MTGICNKTLLQMPSKCTSLNCLTYKLPKFCAVLSKWNRKLCFPVQKRSKFIKYYKNMPFLCVFKNIFRKEKKFTGVCTTLRHVKLTVFAAWKPLVYCTVSSAGSWNLLESYMWTCSFSCSRERLYIWTALYYNYLIYEITQI